MKYQGSCHCKNIEYEVEGDIASLMQCNCSICSKKGYLLWFVPKSTVSIKNTTENFGTYTFNKHIIKHQFCLKCGCSPICFGSDGKGNEMAAINARCLDDIDLNSYTINHYDGRSS